MINNILMIYIYIYI